jgi:hypothetical protein
MQDARVSPYSDTARYKPSHKFQVSPRFSSLENQGQRLYYTSARRVKIILVIKSRLWLMDSCVINSKATCPDSQFPKEHFLDSSNVIKAVKSQLSVFCFTFLPITYRNCSLCVATRWKPSVVLTSPLWCHTLLAPLLVSCCSLRLPWLLSNSCTVEETEEMGWAPDLERCGNCKEREFRGQASGFCLRALLRRDRRTKKALDHARYQRKN